MKLPMLVAEVGSVHDGSFGNAQKLIELAAHCGANAVKFQTHISEAETQRTHLPLPISKRAAQVILKEPVSAETHGKN